MLLERITNLLMAVATVFAIVLLTVSFRALYQAEEIGKGISVDSSTPLPKHQTFNDTDPDLITRSEVIWNGSEIIEIIEPTKSREIR